MFEDIFRRRKAVPAKLLEYGFTREGGNLRYRTDVMDGGFSLGVVIASDGSVDTFLTDKETGEEYVPYKTPATGAYVGKVRSAIADVLRGISLKCYRPSVFKAEQTLRMIDHVSATYGDEPEFLWTKFPDNAVWRRKDTMKWYGAILTVRRSKLAPGPDEPVEILDLRVPPEQMDGLLRRKDYHPGWHMNKKSWCTVILDGSVGDEELVERIRTSHDLATK